MGEILNQLSYDNVKDNLSKTEKIEEFFYILWMILQ
jgi:hypothetical protein